MKRTIAFIIFAMSIFTFAISCHESGSCKANETCDSSTKQIYEWRIYTLTGNNTEILDDFFEKSLIPAYNRHNISVGAFSPYNLNPEEGDQRYLLFVYPDLKTYNQIRQDIWNDDEFLKNATPYFETTAPNPAYSVYETYLSEAFDGMPEMRIPDKSRTLFEYRNYWSPNEDANFRKINMFNVEEIDLFDKVGIHSVFYGEVLAGTRMPALIYLAWFEDEETRNKAWSTFRVHPEWIEMRDRPEYKYTATNNQVKLLSPMSYSQF
jgi:hypothetical protein